MAFRSSVVGISSQRLSPPLTDSHPGSGPLAPPSLPASQLLWACPTPGWSRSQGYAFPRGVGGHPATPPGLPGSSADLSSRAVHKHPGEPDDCFCPCFVIGIRLPPQGEDWPLPALPFHEAESVRFRYGSRVCLPRLRQRNCPLSTLVRLHVRWAIYMVSTSQLTRSARLCLAHPLEGGEGRQARGDVPVGECRLDGRRDIPPGSEAVPTSSEGEIVPLKVATAVQD
jgi:hypothetical protein